MISAGAQDLCREAAPLAATRAAVTEIDRDFEGDVHAPVLGNDWHEVAREASVSSGHAACSFSFVTLERR